MPFIYPRYKDMPGWFIAWRCLNLFFFCFLVLGLIFQWYRWNPGLMQFIAIIAGTSSLGFLLLELAYHLRHRGDTHA